MPVELIAFTADRRISGTIPLTDDRLSDMLNSVARIVIRGAQIEDLVNGGPPQIADLTLAVGSIVAVLAVGRRGVETRRRRTELLRTRVGLTRFVVMGSLHVPAGSAERLTARDPQAVFAGRDVLVPLTDATISYDRVEEPTTERFETILVNRSHAVWVDLDVDDDSSSQRLPVYHAAPPKSLSRTI